MFYQKYKNISLVVNVYLYSQNVTEIDWMKLILFNSLTGSVKVEYQPFSARQGKENLVLGP